jgi:L-cysteate sulfo-lyase
MQLSRFPRVRLGHFPTPLEYLPRLSDALGGPRIYMKRDDCTGLGLGGSKVRKLEFDLGDAIEQGCDTLLIHGLVQSNHARLVAAAAARAGMGCTVLLEDRVQGEGDEHARSGNILLDHLYGAEVRHALRDTDLNAAIDAIAEEKRAAGRAPYIIRGGRPRWTETLGYIVGALEILSQGIDVDVAFDQIIHASDAGGAQAGFLVGFEGMNAGIPQLGVSPGRPAAEVEERVFELANETADRVGLADGILRARVRATDASVGPGYGLMTPEALEAVRLTAKSEGVLLDPVYSGKAMAALIAMIRAGEFTSEQSVLFVHTGGLPAVFAYRTELEDGQ